VRWAGQVARMGEKLNMCSFYGKIRKKRGNWENLDVYGRILIKWISEK
jgi:hypothetical protein